MNRRAFLSGLIATPAIVAASSLMPIRGIVAPLALPTYDLTPAQTWALLRNAPRRTVDVFFPARWWSPQDQTWRREEVFVLGRWLSVGRTDLVDNVSTWRDGIKVDDFRPATSSSGMKAERIFGARFSNFGDGSFNFIDRFSDG